MSEELAGKAQDVDRPMIECVHNWVDEMTGHASCSHCGLPRRWQTLYEQALIMRDEAYQYIVDYGTMSARTKWCPYCVLTLPEGPRCLYHRARIALDNSVGGRTRRVSSRDRGSTWPSSRRRSSRTRTRRRSARTCTGPSRVSPRSRETPTRARCSAS
jgi:hypothetical protein